MATSTANECDPEIVFLCGGRGTRMGLIGEQQQKCMMLYDGKPLLERNFETAYEAFGRFKPILCVGHRAEDVMDYFGLQWQGMPLTYARHEPGSADRGALTSARSHLQGASFLSVHGNILFLPSLLRDIWQKHISSGTFATIALTTNTHVSNHVLMGTSDDEFVSDVQIPPPSSDYFTRVANDNELSTRLHTYNELGVLPYYRDMGVHAYSLEHIFRLLDSSDERIVDMSWLLAYATKLLNPPKAHLYHADWVHVETARDLA